MIRSVFLVVALSSIASSVPAAQDESQAVRDTIRAFYSALLQNNAAAARDVCIEGTVNKDLLEALAASYGAERAYCDAFKRKTGFEPTTSVSTRRRIADRLDHWEVEFGDGVAWTLFQDMSLRRVNGRWRVDLAELDRSQALTEQLELIRGRPALYKQATKQLEDDGKTDWWVVESRFESLQNEFERKYKTAIDDARDVRTRRTEAGIQGNWRIEVSKPPTVENQPTLKPFEGRLRVKGRHLTVECPVSSVSGTAEMYFEDGWLCALQTDEPDGWPKYQWVIWFNHALGRLEGTLMYKSKDTADWEAYSIVGSVAK